MGLTASRSYDTDSQLSGQTHKWIDGGEMACLAPVAIPPDQASVRLQALMLKSPIEKQSSLIHSFTHTHTHTHNVRIKIDFPVWRQTPL